MEAGGSKGGQGSGPGQSPWGEFGHFLGHGLTWTLSTLFFLAIGWWLDGRLGSTPLLTILGAFLGASAGFYSLYHHLVIRPKMDEEKDTE